MESIPSAIPPTIIEQVEPASAAKKRPGAKSSNAPKPQNGQPHQDPALPKKSLEGLSHPRGPNSSGTLGYRPIRRLPTILLCVMDDDQSGGEWIRIRKDRFVIGRREGDLQIGHDTDMSRTHLELTLWHENGQPKLTVRDLESTNGSFVQRQSCKLDKQLDFLIGSQRLSFDPARLDIAQPSRTAEADSLATRPHSLQSEETAKPVASFVRFGQGGEQVRYPLHSGEQQIGRNEDQCQICFPDDLLLDPVHARVFHSNNEWKLHDCDSRNGIWMRFKELTTSRDVMLQIGEQRLLIKFPDPA